MDERGQRLWSSAYVHARAFLRRWNDVFTRELRDDLAQDVAMASWRYVAGREGVPKLRAIVRTISRRTRGRALHLALRGGATITGSDVGALPAPSGAAVSMLRVQGLPVPQDWLLARLGELLAGMRATNRNLVLAYYEGFSCAELSARFGLSEDVVKVRLHRSRRNLRRKLEVMTRAAGYLEE